MNVPEALTHVRRWLSPEPAFTASPEVRESAGELAARGLEHLRAARAAVDERLFASAATLYGRAISALLQARRLADGSEAPGTDLDAASHVSASPFGSTDPGRDAQLMLEDRPIVGARPGRRRRLAIEGLDRLATGLAARVYPATDADVRGLRLRRQLAAGVLLFVVVAGVGRWLTAPRNVARGKRVTSSSVRFGAPQALVNGAIEWGTFGLHTTSGGAWATIDLGDFYPLAYAEIYGRGDGHVDSGLPLSVDLSDDGAVFRPAGVCRDIFTQATPCVVPLGRQRARFVRVSASEIVLSEVEVYAAR